MSTLIVVACLIVCFSSLTLGYEPYRKQLSGPPSEFELHRLPRPSMVIQEEQSAFIRFVLKPGFNRRELWVDGDTFAFSFMSPVSNVVKLRLWNPSEQRVSLKPSRQDAMFPVGGVNLKHDAFLFENPEKGRWILEMYLMQENTMEEAAIILWNESPLRMYSHLDTYNLHLHESIGVVSRVARLTEEVRQLLGSTMSGHSINADQDAMMIEARLDIVAPNGTEVDIVMMDDGQHGDLLANDGVYAGSIIAPEEGVYKVEATVRGRLGDGQSFQRSTQHLIAVVEDRVDFVGHAWMQTNSDLSYYSEDVPTADIFIQIDHQTSQPAILQKRRANGVNVNVEDDIKAFLRNKYRAYAEIWATDSDGNLQPACWISSMVNVDRIPANKHTDLLSYNAPVYAVRLQLDLRWLKRQGLSEPLTLRNAFITDAKTNIPLAEAEEIEVEPEEAVVLKTVLQKHPLLRSYQAESRITPLMRAGMPSEMRLEKRSKLASTLLSETVEDEHLAMDMNGKKDGGSRRSKSGENRDDEGHNNEEEYDENVVPTLLLTHGYCSEDNPWEGSKGYFSEAAYFVDILQSRTNDEFANMLFDFSEKNGMTHFGIIGHSQGGLASTHMKNYYFTGLDESQGDRVIQSVGSPYKGCRLAGTAALLGRMFGIGCGHNFDLSPDGAALWGSGITTDTRSKVYYYTTTASKGNYCNFASNLVLSKPNDGVTEVDLGTLDGGYYMGNANNECHTINMNYYAQYSNSKRNTEMNEQAAR